MASGVAHPVAPASGATATLRDSAAGRTQLLVDLRVAFILLNEARLRVLARMFGVTHEEANLVTVMALLVAGQAAHERIQRLAHLPHPRAADVMLVSGTAREAARSIAGPAVSEQPMALTLISMALMYGPTRRAIPRALAAAGGATEQLGLGFRQRYGYLFDPGHRRARRAMRRRAAQSSERADSAA